MAKRLLPSSGALPKKKKLPKKKPSSGAEAMCCNTLALASVSSSQHKMQSSCMELNQMVSIQNKI